MARTSLVSCRIVITLAVLALITAACLPVNAQTLEWLQSKVVVPSRVTTAPNDNVLTTLKGNLHPLAQPQYDRGMVSDNFPMQHIILSLQRSPEQEQMLTAVIDGLKNQRSPLYRHWVSPRQFGNHFGPSDADIAVLTQWLQSHGFTIDRVLPGKTGIIFSGTAGQVREAFHTEIHSLQIKGHKHISNMSAPQIPSALAPIVKGFLSLNDFFAKSAVTPATTLKRDAATGKYLTLAGQKAPNMAKPPAKFGKLDTCPPADCGSDYFLVGPQDFYTIYDENTLLTAGINGAGSTIAVIEETDINPADVTSFRSQFALPTYPSPFNTTAGGLNTLFGADGVFCTDPGILTDGEEMVGAVDAEWAGVSAPAAIVDYVSCATTSTTQGIFLSAEYIINDLAPTGAVNSLSPPVGAMSLSYDAVDLFDVELPLASPCEYSMGAAGTATVADMWEQAAAQGQTVVVASGDSGSLGCDVPEYTDPGYGTSPGGASVNALASSAYNIAAGGTDFSDEYQTYNSATGTCCATWWNTGESTQSNGYESALSYVPEMAWGGFCSEPTVVSFWQELDLCGEIGICGTTQEQVCNSVYNVEGGGYGTGVAGGGGGVSVYNQIPTWQSTYGVGLAGNNTSTTFRNLPDVSLFAAGPCCWNSHDLLFCESDIATCSTYGDPYPAFSLVAGGTGFVAAEVAGVMGLVYQKTGAYQGPANYNLYGLASQEYGQAGGTFSGSTCSGSGLGAGVGSTCLFRDVANDTPCGAGTTCLGGLSPTTIGSDIVNPCETGSSPNCDVATAGDFLGMSSVSNASFIDAYPTSQGYDAATGLGSIDINNLVSNWNNLTTLWPTTTTISANPTSISGTETTTLMGMVATTGRGGFVAPLGSVTFYLNSLGGTNLGSGLLTSTCSGTPPDYTCSPGIATLTVGTTAGFQLGANNVIAYFPGDGANDAPSTSAPVVVTVTQLESTASLTSSLNPSTWGAPVTFTASIMPVSSPPPTGTVEFQADGADIAGCSAQPVTSNSTMATATCTTTLLTASGSPHTIIAIYSGDANYSMSTSGPLTQVVNPAVLTVTANNATYSFGSTPPVFTASYSGFQNGDGVGVLSGSPSLTVSCGVIMVAQHHAASPQQTCDLTPGTYTIVAAMGSLSAANYTFAFVNGTLTVTPAATTVTLTSGANPSNQGQSVTFTAALSPVASPNPTGTVDFQANGTDISGCGAVAPSGGIATCTTSSLALGSNTITAVYSGDSNYNGASAAPLTQVVNPATTTTQTVLVVTPPSGAISIKAGQSATVMVNVDTNPSGQPITGLNLTCSVVPAGPTCTLSATPTTLPGTVTATISTTDQNATLRRIHGSALALFALLLPGLLLLPTGSQRIRRRALLVLGGLALVMTFTVMGCGGSSSAPYSAVVTANASNAVSDTAVISFEVHN